MSETETKSNGPRGGAWVVASLRHDQAGGLNLLLTDELGKHPDTTARQPLVWPTAPRSSMDVFVPLDWREFLDAAQQRYKQSLLAPHLEAQRIPVFLRPPAGMEGLDWEFGFTIVAPNVAQPVRFASSGHTRRPPFNLPIDVLAVGGMSNVMSQVQDSSWYTEPEVREQGLVIESTTIGALRQELSTRTRDVVIAPEADWPSVLAAVRSVPVSGAAAGGKEAVARPRLVILAVERSYGEHLLPRRYGVPPGTALLVVGHTPGVAIAQFLREFFYGIFHDQPLHGALQAAYESPNVPFPKPRAWLFADAVSNHYIRISDALGRVEDLKLELRYGETPGNVDAFIERIKAITPQWPGLDEALRGAVDAADIVRSASVSSEQLKVDFSRESRGLVPMSRTLSQLRRALPSLADLRRRLAAIGADADYVKVIASVQQRYVDMALERHDRAIGSYVSLEQQQTLRRRSRYRLRVHIGHRSENSIVVGDPPAIDPLLPELEAGEEGYELEVAVFEKDFELLSDRVVRLHLPRLGGSMPVYFVIRTLEENPAAEMRVNVYHKNHLLQGFLLTAAVTTDETWRYEVPGSKVELDVATTAAFGNLERLQPRALAISVNEDADGATHRIMIKKDGRAARPLRLGDEVIKNQVEAFRGLLKTYTSADKKPLFPTEPAPGAPAPPAFHDAIRALARLGSDISLAVFQDIEDEIGDDLREIRDAEDLTIQVSRHRGNAVFPWSVLYDYRLPRKELRDTAPVCVGDPLPDAPASLDPKHPRGCPHNPGREVYCVRGFWGFRHRVEQVTKGFAAKDAAPMVDLAKAANTVCLASSIAEPPATRLSTDLKGAYGGKFAEFPPPPPPGVTFEDYMWQTASRPAVLVLLSHLSKPGSGDSALKLLSAPGGAEVTLTANDVSESTRFGHVWKDQPRSLVLLMACNSGATTVATLNDFMMAFTAAGAAATVGTEVPVYVSLAARFAKDLIAELHKKRKKDGLPISLGEAVRNVANRLLAQGNPLGLVFSYCGNADLVLS